jgi:hypothetical protein
MLKPSRTARLRFRRFSIRLPRELGNGGPYFAMILINALGYGLFAPFSILYFHQVIGLSLPLVGLGLSIATGVGLVATPLGGQLIRQCVGILWMRLTAAQSSITGAALVPLVGHAAPDFTLRTWDTPPGQTITLSTLKNRAGQPALRSHR